MPIMSRGLSGEISLVIFSLLLGLIFWAIVKQQETVSQTILVPVIVDNQPEFIEFDGFEPSNVAVKFTLRTGDETLARDPGRFRIIIDAAALRNRVAVSESFVEYPIDVTRDMLEFPERLTFSSFDDSPARVTFRARPRIARVPVTPNIINVGSPAEGYRVDLDKIQIDPPEVLVAVDEIRQMLALRSQIRISTEPIDVGGRREQVSGLYALVMSSEQGFFPVPGQAAPSVEVIIPIPEIQTQRVFSDLPIRYQPISASVRALLDPPTATVTIDGPQSIVQELLPEDILLFPRPVAFLDEEQVGEIVDTSLEVRFSSRFVNNADKLKPAIIAPSLVKIRFIPLETKPPLSQAGPPDFNPFRPSAQLGIDPHPSNATSDTPSVAPPTSDAPPERTDEENTENRQPSENSSKEDALPSDAIPVEDNREEEGDQAL